jgi:tetratricopeptide (TPR) repeat protein
MFLFDREPVMKKITLLLGATFFFAVMLSACSSPEEKAASYIENAKSLFDEGKLKKAEIEYKNALQVNQNLADAWYGLAKIHERRQEWRKAYATLNKIRDFDPNHVNGRIMLAQILLASNQIDQALQDATEVMEMAPDDSRVHSLMAAVQFRLDNFESAQVSVNRALEIDPDNVEAVLVRARVLMAEQKLDQALLVLDEALQGDAENISLYLMKIQAYQELKDRKAVETVYQKLIEIYPDNVSYRHALVSHYMRDNEVDKAEKVLEEIIQLDPDNIEEKARLASFKFRYRSVDDAIALMRQYIEQNSEQYRFRFDLAEIYERNQQPAEAARIYNAIVEDDGLKQNGLEARNKLALLDIKAGKLDNARQLVNEVLAHDKANENALLLLAGFKINDEEYDAAIIDLRTVLRDNPRSAKALGLLGQAYSIKGSNELAIESYTKAYQLNPGTPAIANQLARMLLQRSNPQQADDILQRSINQGNNSIDAVKLLTQVKLVLRDWDQAERLADQLTKVEGEEATSQQVMGLVLQGRQKHDESISAFKKAHELAPESSRPVLALVETYIRNNRIGDARRFLNSILEQNKDNLTANLLIGQLNVIENKPDEAISYFKRVVDINPRLDLGYRNLSSTYVRENQLDKAEAINLKGLEQLPDSSILSINLASIYERQLKFDQAIAIYESMLERNPDLIVAKNNLASLLTDHRDDQESLDRARRIATEFRDSAVPQFRDTYAWAAVRSGLNLEEAVALLEGIVKENAQIGVYHFHLGEAYRKKGDTENAIAYLQKTVELEQPGSNLAKQAGQILQQLNQ